MINFSNKQHFVCVVVSFCFFSHLTKRHWTEHAERAECLFKNVRVSYPFSTVAFALENYLCPYRHDKWTGTKPLIIANWNETFCLQFYLLFGYFQWSSVFFFSTCHCMFLMLNAIVFVQCSILKSIISLCKWTIMMRVLYGYEHGQRHWIHKFDTFSSR